MHKRIQSDKPVVFSFQLQEKEGEKIDEIGQIFKSFQADQTQDRSQCDAGRVLVNGKLAKASVKVKVGDVIEIQFGTKTVKVEVLDIQDTTKKEEAKDLFRYL